MFCPIAREEEAALQNACARPVEKVTADFRRRPAMAKFWRQNIFLRISKWGNNFWRQNVFLRISKWGNNFWRQNVFLRNLKVEECQLQTLVNLST